MSKEITLFFGPAGQEVLLILDRLVLTHEKLKSYRKHRVALLQEHREECGQRTDDLAERNQQVVKLRQRIKELDGDWDRTVENKWEAEKQISRRATWLKLKRLFGNEDLNVLESRVAELKGELTTLEQRLQSERGTLQQVNDEYAEIAAPIESLEYGIERIRNEIEEEKGEDFASWGNDEL